jgi:anti-repressor protein
MDLGLFRLVEGTRTNSSGTTITKTTKVTGKGQTYFVNKFLKEIK